MKWTSFQTLNKYFLKFLDLVSSTVTFNRHSPYKQSSLMFSVMNSVKELSPNILKSIAQNIKV